MVRLGKERADAPDQPEAPETVQDARWLNGVNRQLQPDAPSHQQAASRAAATKRKADAMTGEEKAAAERRRADRRNAAKRAKRAAAAPASSICALRRAGPRLSSGTGGSGSLSRFISTRSKQASKDRGCRAVPLCAFCSSDVRALKRAV